jgi:uncharacterized damage-inducible protein DinB
MSWAAHFSTMAAYNAWANRRLYDACAALPEAEYLQARPSFFGSIHNTLNHILVGDRLWLARVEGDEPPHRRLNEVPYADLTGLRAAREAEDAHIAAVVTRVDEAGWAEDLVYRTSAGAQNRTPLVMVFTHLFNHETHHRGQVHDMLSQTPVQPPELDLIYFLRRR